MRQSSSRSDSFLKALVALFACLLFSSCFLLPEEEQVLAPPLVSPPKVKYRTLEVKHADIERKAYLLGYVEPAVSIELYFTEKGRLARIYVEKGDFVQKGDILAELNMGSLPIQLEQRQIALKKSEMQYELQQILGANRYDLRLAAFDVELTRLQLADVQDRIDGVRLKAPFSGYVRDVSVDEGAFVEAFRPVVVLDDPNNLIVKCSPGKDLEHFHVGMTVMARIRNKLYEGEITKIPSLTREIRISSKEEFVLIDVFGIPPELYNPSESVPVIIAHTLEKSEDTIVVPNRAVHKYTNRFYVKVLEEGLAEDRFVSVGIQTSTEVEIVDGLEEGELLVLD